MPAGSNRCSWTPWLRDQTMPLYRRLIRSEPLWVVTRSSGPPPFSSARKSLPADWMLIGSCIVGRRECPLAVSDRRLSAGGLDLNPPLWGSMLACRVREYDETI